MRRKNFSNLNINTDVKKYNEDDYYLEIDKIETIEQEDIENSNFIAQDENAHIEYYKKLLEKLDDDAIIDQARQIINYSDNDTQGGALPLISLFENCSIVLKKLMSEQGKINSDELGKFRDSLDNSQVCLMDKHKYENMISNLESNNKNSFVIAPLIGKGHLFSVAVYKKDDNFEFIVVNKGGRYDASKNEDYNIFEKYVVPKDKLSEAVNIFQNLDKVGSRRRPVDYVYNNLKSISSEHISLKEIDARDQRVGNCFFKELEEAFKLAYSEAYDGYEKNTYVLSDGTNITRKTPKFPIKTEEFHKKLLDNLIDYSNSENVKEKIKYEKDIYAKNKEFREEIAQNRNKNFEEKEELLKKHFQENDVMECLKKVDERTLQENADFFIDVLYSRELDIPQIIYNARDEILATDFFESNAGYLEKAEENGEIKLLEKYFPQIATNIEKKMKVNKIDKIIGYIDYVWQSDEEAYDIVRELCNEVLLLGPDRRQKSTIKTHLGDCEKAEGNYKKALASYKEAYDLSIDMSQRNIIRRKYNNTVEELKNNIKKIEQKTNVDGEYNNIGKSMESVGKLEDALKLYNSILEKEIPNVNEKVSILTQKAKLLEKMGRKRESDRAYLQAILRLNDALKNDPNNYELIKKKGDILRIMGHNKDALSEYDKAEKNILNIQDEDLKNDKINYIKKIKENLEIKNAVQEDIKNLKVDRTQKPEDIDMEIQKYSNIEVYDAKTVEKVKTLARKLEVLGRREEALQLSTNILEHVDDGESFERAMRLFRETGRSEFALNVIDSVIADYDINDAKDKMLNDNYINYRIIRYQLLKDIGENIAAIDEAVYISQKLKEKEWPEEEKKEKKLEMLKVNAGLAELLYKQGDKKNALMMYRHINSEFIKDGEITPRIITMNIKEISKELAIQTKGIEKKEALVKEETIKEQELKKGVEKVKNIVAKVPEKEKKSNTIKEVDKKETSSDNKNKAIKKEKNGLIKIKPNKIMSKIIHKIRKNKTKNDDKPKKTREMS